MKECLDGDDGWCRRIATACGPAECISYADVDRVGCSVVEGLCTVCLDVDQYSRTAQSRVVIVGG